MYMIRECTLAFSVLPPRSADSACNAGGCEVLHGDAREGHGPVNEYV
jgi:hypothetical protein